MGTILSLRQREIALLVAEGLTSRQIAVRLGISEQRVKTQRSAILAKLGISSSFGIADALRKERG